MSRVVERVIQEEMTVELYDDGSCMLALNFGPYIQLQEATLERIIARYKKKPVAPAPTDKPEAPEPTELKKRITPTSTADKVGTAWQVEYLKDSKLVEVQGYVSRNAARNGSLDTAVGQAGRVS